MAQELVPRLWDDWELDEHGIRIEASVTDHVGIDGAWYQLDLTSEHYKMLRETLERCKRAGLKLDGPPPKPRRNRTLTRGQLAPGSGAGKKVREWADANGMSDEWHKKTTGDGYYYSKRLRLAYADAMEAAG